MKQSDKLKVLIDSIKTANELAAKQIEKNRRSIELLGEFITEPETLGKAPHSDNVPSLSGFNMVGQEIDLGNEWVEDETIKPEDMKAGEWYKDSGGWMYKFSHISSDNRIFTFKACLPSYNAYYNHLDALCNVRFSKSIRKATQEEILKYFPNELEVPTHGGNDAAYIQEVTDKKL